MQPQELVVTILGNELLHRPSTPVWSGGLVRLLDCFGFSEKAARAALSRIVDRGLLVRERDGREIDYRLTERAARLLAEGEARILAFGADEVWDGSWTYVTYALRRDQRSTRDRLRRRMGFLGFGALRDGTWIAPRDRSAEVATLLDELELRDGVAVFVGRVAATTSPEDLIDQAWDLRELPARYARFTTDHAERVPADDLDALVIRTELMHRYREFPTVDPDLPDEVLDWGPARRAAIDTFHRNWTGLAPAAARGFAELTARSTR